jgi:hypothetical protein
MTFRRFLHGLYAVGFVAIGGMLALAYPYYALPVEERPHSPMHAAFKPGGSWGHGFGIIGSALVLLLFLYSVRKRRWLGLRLGRLSRWLDVHILFGIMGPLLITLHTAGKLGGIVSISYFSMLAVAFSGVFGRYIYMQIPRDVRGHTIGLDAVERRIGEIEESLRADYGLPGDVVDGIRRFAQSAEHDAKGVRAFMQTIVHDLTLRRRVARLRRFIRQGHQEIPEEALGDIVRLAREQSVLRRRVALLGAMTRMFHHWHVFHKPFAVIMIVIMFVHVGVTIAFGYRWVF